MMRTGRSQIYWNYGTAFCGFAAVLCLFAGTATAQKAGKSTPAKPAPASAPHSAAAAPAKPISFNNDIVPMLTRAGCNAGSCHGSQFGKGGYKLSLAGFDPDLDYQNTVKQAKGRRVSIVDPIRSLILLKPSMSVPHGGGLRLTKGSADYLLLERWLKSGAQGPIASDPTVTGIQVIPQEKAFAKPGQKLQLKVVAVYSDGSKREVTSHARIGSLNDAIASCTPDGLVTASGRGQTAIMIRYSGQATVATMVLPYPAKKQITPAAKDLANPIDALVARKQAQLGLPASPLCDDRTFIRRVSFDLIGTAPKENEIEAFLSDSRPDKRVKLVDALLDRPEYADYWTLKWGDLLRSNRPNLGVKGMWSFSNWIHNQLNANRPVNGMVHDLIMAQGSTYTNGPSNYYRVASNPQDLAETTSQVFMGVRLQCARCHHHPFEKWSQADYYQFAAFFARIGLKSSNDFGVFGNENIVKIQDGGEVYHPKTGAKMQPTPLGLQLAVAKGEKTPDPDAEGDRRMELANWLTSKDNRFFARNIANRYWGYMFGKGIVNPIDDQRITNPPTNPALLEALADELVKSGFDLKQMLRTICTTRTYQRSSAALPGNRQDELFFTHYEPKQLNAESLLDAIDFACGTQEKFPELPKGTRAIQLPDPSVNSDFLDVFGRPQRLIACECERQSEPNLSQTLRLMNGDLINRKVGEGDGRLAIMIKAKLPDETILNTIYESTLARPPRVQEKRSVMGVLAFTADRDRKSVFEDVLITLLNSKEFLFNH
jgi:hypothetical protein